MILFKNLLIFTFVLLLPMSTIAAPITVRDYNGTLVYFPQGERSFADRVASTSTGSRKPIELTVPSSALGAPDWDVPDTQTKNFPDKAYSLGCKGKLAVQFEDNALIDGDGDDLFVFEVGANVEPANIYVSNNGKSWESVGKIGGALSAVDLAKFSLRSDTYRYVLIEDLGSRCSDRLTPGADIDAVGAIGSAERIILDGAILFDTGKTELNERAKSYLNDVVEQLHKSGATKINVTGHTDAVGNEINNHKLGIQRAEVVVSYIISNAPILRPVVRAESRGELEPVASNANNFGRQKNRRVEITIFTN